MANSLKRGDIIEFDGKPFRVWEITSEFYGLLPSTQQESTDESVYYIPKSSSFKLIVRRNVLPFLSVPADATFLLETCPDTEFDLTKMRLWTDGFQGHLELHHVRMTGVLGVSDGSFTQKANIDHQEIADIEREMQRIGYWELDEKSDRPMTSDLWWFLKATDGVRTHSVERFGNENEIRGICEQCYNLINWNDLESGSFNVV